MSPMARRHLGCGHPHSSYLVVLRPAVLDQVPHVVELTGVTPAPWRGLSEW